MGQPAAVVSDLLLVDRCKEGEQAASRELFRSHQRRVHSTLYRILGSCRDMDDLMQETFIQVFRSLHNYRGEAKLATWIDRIAVRVAYRYIARNRNVPVPVEDVENDIDDGRSHSGPRDQAAARLGVQRLYEALQSLTPAARVAFALFEIDGRTIAEVAEATGMSTTAAKLRIWRARRALLKIAAADPLLAELLGDSLDGTAE